MLRAKSTLKAVLQTITYGYAFIVVGIVVSLIGPTFIGLQAQTGATVEQMGFIFTSRGLGRIASGFITGKVLQWLTKVTCTREHLPNVFHILVLCFGCIVATVIMSCIPLITNIYGLIVVYAFIGAAGTILDVTINTFAVWIWQEKVNTWMHFLHGGFGIGAFMCPFIISVSGIAVNVAHWIVAAFIFSVLLLVLGVHLLPIDFVVEKVRSKIKPTEQEKPESIEMQDVKPAEQAFVEEPKQKPSICENIRKWFMDKRTQVSFLLGTALFGIVGIEASYGGLILTYLVKTGVAPEAHATILNSAFWLLFIAGRIVGVIVSCKLKPKHLVLPCTIFVVISMVILLAFPTNLVAIWVGSCMLGFSIAGLYAMTIGFSSSTLKMNTTPSMMSIMVVIASIGEMVNPLIITSLFPFGPIALFWVCWLNSMLLLLVYFIIFVVYY